MRVFAFLSMPKSLHFHHFNLYTLFQSLLKGSVNLSAPAHSSSHYLGQGDFFFPNVLRAIKIKRPHHKKGEPWECILKHARKEHSSLRALTELRKSTGLFLVAPLSKPTLDTTYIPVQLLGEAFQSLLIWMLQNRRSL